MAQTKKLTATMVHSVEFIDDVIGSGAMKDGTLALTNLCVGFFRTPQIGLQKNGYKDNLLL
jgi:hypothetical protein